MFVLLSAFVKYLPTAVRRVATLLAVHLRLFPISILDTSGHRPPRVSSRSSAFIDLRYRKAALFEAGPSSRESSVLTMASRAQKIQPLILKIGPAQRCAA